MVVFCIFVALRELGFKRQRSIVLRLHSGCAHEYCYKGMAETMHPVSKSKYFLGKSMMWHDMILIIPNHFFLVSKSQNSSTRAWFSHYFISRMQPKGKREEEDSKGKKKK